MIADAEHVLRDVFGLPSFRPGQAEVVSAVLAGRDVLSVAPTGSGKSISYWVPAVMSEGTTLVISPLIALMKDQVDRLGAHGVAATFVNSSLDRAEQVERLRKAAAGHYRLLFLAPERLARPGFLDRLAALPIRRIVVDEAHCISTWGHDFRPDYRLLGGAVKACGSPPVAAFTATATPRVREDIARNLELRDPLVSITGFNRPNLRLEVVRCRGDRGKREQLTELMRTAGRTLVYVGTVAAAEELGAELGAACYHGRLDASVRQRVQEDFTAGRSRVIVATSAFGMGVDVPDIRQVVHYHIPGSVEAYYQEAGRAGRDGLPAVCTLLYSGADRDLQAFFIEQSGPDADPAVKEHAYARLAQMMAYAEQRECRHARIADYFGETGVARTCQACDNCLSDRPPEVEVAETDTRAALAAVARFSGRVGLGNVAAVLGGRNSKWVSGQPWVKELEFHGALAAWSEQRIRLLLAELTAKGYARQSSGEYPVVELTPAGRDAVRDRATPRLTLPAESRANRSPATSGSVNADLLERLKRWRRETARQAGVPAYVVFHDSTLVAIAAAAPSSRAELLRLPGLGPAKLERYGDDLLTVLHG